MARPRLGDEPYEKLTVRIDKNTMGDILAYMEHLKAASMGLRVDLGGTARRLLLYGLQYAKEQDRFQAPHHDQADTGEATTPASPPRSRKKATAAKG